MVRVPWVSVSLLLVSGLLGALTYAAKADDANVDGLETALGIIGWVGVGGSLVVGALGLWARAPATLATALGILGTGAFAGMWLSQFVQAGDDAGLHLGMVIAFVGVLVAFAASARRPT